MAYNITGFITHAMNGDAIRASSSIGINNIIIADQPITLSTVTLDLGNYFTAVQVLESYQLRAGIVGGNIIVDAGSISLAKTW